MVMDAMLGRALVNRLLLADAVEGNGTRVKRVKVEFKYDMMVLNMFTPKH